VDGSQKSIGSLILKGGSSLVLLQFGKEVLNQVSPAILASVELPGFFLIELRWNHCFHPVLLNAIQESYLCSVVGFVCQKGLDLIQQSFQQHVSILQVMGLTGTQMKTSWIAERITGCMYIGRQAPTGATYTLFGAITFFASALC